MTAKKSSDEEILLTLYVGNHCAYSAMVIHALEELHLQFVEKNIDENPAYLDELLSLGRSVQTPYLVDAKEGIRMYESALIVEYLMRMYGADKTKK